ncbi:hypothetical protein HOB10_03160 [Candidatus Parcubacteria bacterium]|jgi:hypothetical protein|nr:hypothetical protein [Candidatus Parcubacteria bacterium]
MSLVKRLLVFSLVITTVLSFSPINVEAAGSYGAGSLLAKEGVEGAAVYYIGSDDMKYVFPDSKTYFTWYEDFSDVVRVPVTELDMYGNGGAVTYRPGTYLVTHEDTANVYGIGAGGMYHLIPSEAVATDLYGADWGSMVMDVIPGYFSTSYTEGSDLSDMYPTGTLLSDGTDTYYVDGTSKRIFVDADAFEANGLMADNVLEVSDLSDYSDGSSIDGEESDIAGFMPGEGTPGDPVISGSLSLSLASDTPNPGIYPSTASGLEMLKFKAKAGSDGAVLDGITIGHGGVGATTEFIKIYLYEGESRLTSGKTINSSTNATEFNNLNIDFSANETKYLTVVADAGVSKSGTHLFSITAAELEAGTATLGSIVGNAISLGTANAGEVVITEGSDPSNGKVGEQDAELTSFTLTVDSIEDSSFERISLYHAGAVSRGDLTDLELYKNSKSAENLVASTSGLDSEDLAVFVLDTPVDLEKGQAVKFYVYGDISGDAKSGSAETVNFYLDETSDLKVMGNNYNAPLGVDNYDQSFNSSTGSGTYNGGAAARYTTMYLEGSDVTLTTDGPSATNIDAGGNSADDINLLNFAIALTQEADLKSIQVELHAVTTDMDASDTTVTSNYITDVKIVNTDTGTTVWGPTDISSFSDIGNSAGVSKTWTDTETLAAGTHNYKVTADFKNSSLDAGSKIYAVLGDKADGNTLISTAVKSTGNNTYLTSIVPSSYTQGANMTLKGPALKATRATTPNSDDIVKGADGVTVANLIFSAEDSGADLKITSVKFSGYVDGWSRSVILTKDQTGSTLAITDLVSYVRAYAEEADGSETLLGTKAFNSSGEVTFSSIAWNIPAGETRNLRVAVDTNAGHTATVGLTTMDAFAVDITDFSADVSAETSSGTALTAAQMGTATSDLPNTATTAATGPKFAMYSAGTITVQDGADKPAVTLVTTGSSDVYYHQLEVYTAYEDLAISKMKFLASEKAGNFASVKLTGKNTAGDTVSYTTDVDGSGYATFTGMDLKADDDGENIDMYVTLNTVTNGALVGSSATWDLQTTGFEANGVGGSNTNVASFTNSDAASAALYVVKSKPVFANAGSNGSLADGVNTLYKFTVTPAGEGKIAIKKLKFNVDASDASGSTLNLHSFRLYKGTSCDTAIDTAFFTDGVYGTTTLSLLNTTTADYGDAAASVAVYMFFEGTSDSSYTDASDYYGELVVPTSGETYCLKATVANSATNDSVVASIAEEGQDTSGPTYGALAYDLADYDSLITIGTDSDIIWSDYSSTTSHQDSLGSGTSSDFFGGRYLPGLQSDATSLSKS